MIFRVLSTQAQRSLQGDEVLTARVAFGSQAEQVAFLRSVVDLFRGHHAIVQRARDIVFRQYGCAPRNQLAHAVAIGDWVQRNIGYVNELPERFQTPPTTVSLGYGDCDDFCTLTGAMLESVGIPSQLVALKMPDQQRGLLSGIFPDPNDVKHIFCRAIVRTPEGERTVPLDATLTRPIAELADPIEIALGRGGRLSLFVM